MAKKTHPQDDLKIIEERKQRHQPPPVRYQPNLTPLIDVLFLLLLFFLLGTRFRHEEGSIPGTLPQIGGEKASASPVSLPPSLYVDIEPAGANAESAWYSIAAGRGTQILTADDLYNRLAAMYSTYGKDAKDVPVFIRPRPDVRWEFTVEAFNQVARAKFTSIGFGSGGN